MIIKLYRLSYEDGEYCIGTEAEVIQNHNEWVENSGRFELDEMDDNLATTIQDKSLHEHWTVEHFYTVNVKIDADYEMRLATYHKEVDYLTKVNEILWSYIPESDYELNEKISKEINEVEAK